MTTTEAAQTIARTWASLRAGDLTADEARDVMGRLRSEMGEAEYEKAKWAAAAAESRR